MQEMIADARAIVAAYARVDEVDVSVAVDWRGDGICVAIAGTPDAVKLAGDRRPHPFEMSMSGETPEAALEALIGQLLILADARCEFLIARREKAGEHLGRIAAAMRGREPE